jgi:predicted site-specific integrase-resolvase
MDSQELRDVVLLTEREVASIFRVSVRTLQNWRVTGGGPEFVKLGSRVVYRTTSIRAFLNERQRRSTSEATP